MSVVCGSDFTKSRVSSVFQNRTITHETMACGYKDNSVKAYKSSFVCGLGCERWHHSHIKYDPEYKNQISNNLGREIFNFKISKFLPEDLEVSQKKYRELTLINVWFMSNSKCSNWCQISKLMLNFGCLLTFCYFG